MSDRLPRMVGQVVHCTTLDSAVHIFLYRICITEGSGPRLGNTSNNCKMAVR